VALAAETMNPLASPAAVAAVSAFSAARRAVRWVATAEQGMATAWGQGRRRPSRSEGGAAWAGRSGLDFGSTQDLGKG
jgi:hypothetical protein